MILNLNLDAMANFLTLLQDFISLALLEGATTVDDPFFKTT